MDLTGRKVKVVHIHAGVDLIGSKTSMAASRNVSLTLTKEGVHMYSKGSEREVVIPFGNIKGFELFPVEQVAEKSPSLDQAPKRGRPVKTTIEAQQ